MIRTQVQLTEEQMKELKKLAMEEGVSVSELVRRGVDLIVHSRRSPDRKTRIERATSMAGRFRSGLGDLAEEHDKYL